MSAKNLATIQVMPNNGEKNTADFAAEKVAQYTSDLEEMQDKMQSLIHTLKSVRKSCQDTTKVIGDFNVKFKES